MAMTPEEKAARLEARRAKQRQEIEESAREAVRSAPPVSQALRDRLAVLLTPPRR